MVKDYPAYQKDIDELQTYIDKCVNTLKDYVVDELERFAKEAEDKDKQIATMALAIGELTVLVEGLVGQLMFASSDEQEHFQKNQEAARREMLRIMKEGAGIAVENTDPEPSESMEDVVEPVSTDTSD
jgi:cell division septum initiation protein DivIVA